MPEEDEALVGEWESVERVGGQRNTLEIADAGGDLVGLATLYFYLNDDPTLYYANYAAFARIKEKDRRYEISMICDEDFNCSSLDFTMNCRAEKGRLTCSGSDWFAGYEALDFERRRGG